MAQRPATCGPPRLGPLLLLFPALSQFMDLCLSQLWFCEDPGPRQAP